MKNITITVREKEGLHARPAGILSKAAKEFQSKITMTKGAKTVDVTRLFAVMGLAVKCGEQITITCEGPDEDAALKAMSDILQELS